MAAQKLVNFVDASPSPFHAVHQCCQLLKSRGFSEIKECDAWNIKPLGKYFVTTNQSSIFAFAVGGKFVEGSGFTLTGAHSDSPCLKVKPNCKRGKQDFIQVGVAPYGGGIWQTWFDRELKLAGRVITKSANGSFESKLVHINKPLLHIPTMCIHLYDDYRSKWCPNNETHLLPILATETAAKLNDPSSSPNKDISTSSSKEAPPPKTPTSTGHSPYLMKTLSDELGVPIKAICDFELCLADYTPARIGGMFNEFIFASRLDNLFNAFTTIEGLTQSVDDSNNSGEHSLANDPNIRAAVVFDNEEVGSQTAQGACSLFVTKLLQRLSGGTPHFEMACAKSYMLSADQAHAYHPNYSDKYEDNHKPTMHGGIIVKVNVNQRYATTSVTSSILKEIASRSNVPLQEFVVRNDSRCGTTIGPIFAAGLGIQTCDIGGPQLSMHSIREMCGTESVQQAIDLYKGYFRLYPAVNAAVNIDF